MLWNDSAEGPVSICTRGTHLGECEMEVLCDLSLSRRRVTNLQHHHQLHRFSLPDNSSLVHNAIKKENKDGWLAWRQPHRDAKAEGAHDGDACAGQDHAQRRPRRPAKEVLAHRHC